MNKITTKKIRSLLIISILSLALIPVDQRGGSVLSNLFDLDPPIQRASAVPSVSIVSSPTAATCFNGNTNILCEPGDTVVITATLSPDDPCFTTIDVKFYRMGSLRYTDTASPWTFNDAMLSNNPTNYRAKYTCDTGGGSASYWSSYIYLYPYISNVSPTITDPTTPVTQEYATTGTFGITWNVADTDGNLDWIAVDDAAGGYDYSSGGAYFYDGTISGSSDSMITTWNKDDWLGTKTFRGRVADTDAATDTSVNVVVNIFDTTDPSVTSTPSNLNCEYASSGTCTVGNWAATDFLPSQYKIQRKAGSGGNYADVRSLTTWVSGNSYTFDHPKNLAIGIVYYYKAYFIDTSTNDVWSGQTLVTQQDTTDPTQTARPATPSNVEYNPSGSTTLTFWTGDDELPSQYRIMRKFDAGSYAELVTWASWTTTTQQITYPHPNNLALGTYKYRIEWKDTSGNTYTSTALEITVNQQDTTNPVVTVAQNDIGVEYAASGTTQLSWTATDLLADDYQIERQLNGGGYAVIVAYGNGWTSGVATTYDHSNSLAIGTYNYRITFKDTTPNTITDIAVVTQQDTTDPLVTIAQNDISVEYAASGTTQLSWTATDLLADDYQIERQLNGGGYAVIVAYGNGWTSGVATTYEHSDNIALGTYDYRITFKDTTPNTITDIAIVTQQDTTNPVMTVIPDDKTLEYAPVGSNQFQWRATDLLADDYQIEREFNGEGYSVIRAYGNGWTSGQLMAWNHELNLAIGTYNYRITFNDTTDNIITDVLVVTQQDTTNPVITDAQIDISVEYFITGSTQLSWTATDYLADDYQIERQFNGGGYNVIVAYGNGWTSGVAITYDHPDNMAIGTYDYRITFKDTTPNIVQDTAVITQIAGESPTFTQTPNNVTYIHGNTSTINVQWSFSDNGNVSLEWQLYYNNITYTGDGSDMTGWTGLGSYSEIPYLTPTVKTLIYDVGSLTEDRYFVIRVIDDAGYIGLNEISVLISPLIIVQPFNIEGHDTDLEMYLPFDGDVLDYSLSGNDASNSGATFVTGQYGDAANLTTSTATSINLPNAKFPHLNSSFTWAFWMYVGQNPSTYQIFVSKLGSPTGLRLTLLSNGLIEMTATNDAGSTSFSATPSIPLGEWFHIVYTWDGAGTRNIYKNGKYWDTHTHPGTYNNPSTSFMLGYPNIHGFDGKLDDFRLYSSIKNEYFIKQLYQEGSPLSEYSSADEKSKLVFSIYDNPLNGTWNIYRNGTTLKENQIWNTTLILYDITENGTLLDGFYNWTLIAWDDTTPTINTTIIYLIPYSTIAPNIYLSPQNVTYTNIAGNKISWNVVENHPQIYRTYLNNTNIVNSTYSEGIPTILVLNNLQIGIYNITIVFIDNANRFDTHTMWLTLVVDQDDPIITQSPKDTRFAWNANNSYLYFSIYDLSNGTWEIQRNGTIVDSGSFSSGNFIIGANISIGYDISATNVIFNFTIIITDYFGNEILDQVWVYFDDDLTSPQLLVTPDDIIMVNGTIGNIISWAWFDTFPSHYTISVDGEPINSNYTWSNSDSIYFNLDYLSVGSYIVVITVYDTTYDTNTDSVNVEVF
ncbi:hypothetical protein LCGC14_0175980 [marine sediment metagenome]|uniref:LamG-like jellyroll fold domain-containing protein n=1 Tax=marine sediment metagenome TaxID=412755 RepID=A0A0F9UVG3_9ZZZZ